MTRAKTGIPGFDALVDGGLPRGVSTMVVGPTGSGKSIFGLQYLYKGADLYDEPGVLVTLESRPQEVRRTATTFGWDLSRLEADGKFVIIDAASNRAGLPTSEKHALRRGFDLATLAEEIYTVVNESGAKRLTIDSFSALNLPSTTPSVVRGEVLRISALLNELGLTSLLISDTPPNGVLSQPTAGHHVAQGLVILHLDMTNLSLRRSIVVWKMRHTSHSLRWHELTIEGDGIHIGDPLT